MDTCTRGLIRGASNSAETIPTMVEQSIIVLGCPCGEIKSADQLPGYCAAYLWPSFFCICRRQEFS